MPCNKNAVLYRDIQLPLQPFFLWQNYTLQNLQNEKCAEQQSFVTLPENYSQCWLKSVNIQYYAEYKSPNGL